MPRAEDLPSRLRCIFVDNGDGAGPFGAKGASEGSLTGVRFRELPLTPERVWRALRARPKA